MKTPKIQEPSSATPLQDEVVGWLKIADIISSLVAKLFRSVKMK